MAPPQRGADRGEAPRPPAEEWEALRARLEAFQRRVRAAENRDDSAALREACTEGLELLGDMEGLLGRLATARPLCER